MQWHVLSLLVLAACGSASAPQLDGGGDDDDAPIGPDAAEPDAPAGAYSHTIAIDGGDDFVGVETFATTSAGYTARIAWDAENVYVGYSGPDLVPSALDTASKWVFAYVDVDPGGATGGTTSETYNTQTAQFPAGFGTELYARWKCDGTLASIQQRDSNNIYTLVATPVAAQSGDFVELAIPRNLFAGASQIGLVTWMINEKPNFEGSFAGMFAGNFTDGYAMTLPLTKYLRIDFASANVPNDPANTAP